jgi:hypothetical protein
MAVFGTPWMVAAWLLRRAWWRQAGARLSRLDGPGWLLAAASATLPAERRDWGAAMTAELAQVPARRERWRFAAGCARAAVLPPGGSRAPVGVAGALAVVATAAAATRLRAHAAELGLDGPALAGAAGAVRAAIRDRFACPGPFGTQWAYESDGRGRHRRYHDANDLPTALAPLWGLCPAADPVWSATMRFAFDPANPGWSPGRWGGLGSAHTPGSWPLGDVQEWVVASLLGETGRDSDTGAWLARHWFAWPSAVLAALALGAGGPGV